MEIRLREAKPEDAGALGAICYEAFCAIADQHNFPHDFPSAEVATGLIASMIEHPDVYGVVADQDGRPIGSNFLSEQSAIAGVGPITVHPGAQNGTIGRQLMQRVLERAAERRFVGVRLVQAAYHNRSLSLYAKLGFDAREPLSVIQGPPLGLAIPGYTVRAAAEADREACNQLCRRVHGLERDGELRDAIRGGTAVVVERDRQIAGYTTGVAFFAHTVAESNAELQALIGAAPGFGGPGFLLPTRNTELLRWCLSRGLRVVQPLTLMSLGLYNEPAGAFLPSILF